MKQNRNLFVRTILITCLILLGFTVQGHSQQQTERVLNPEMEKIPKTHKTIKRPARYPTAIAGLEVLADLTVSPISHKGPCPAVFTFKGKITVNRATVVQYRFIRSDNTRHALGVLNFDKPGTREVTDIWEFDDPTQLPAVKGWAAIQINFPMKVRSNVAYIAGTCTDYKGGPPTPESPKAPKPPKESTPDWPQPDPLLPPVKR